MRGLRTSDQISLKHSPGSVGHERGISLGRAITEKAETRAHRDVVRVNKANRRLASECSDVAVLKVSIVIYRDFVKAVIREESIRDARKQVVCD